MSSQQSAPTTAPSSSAGASAKEAKAAAKAAKAAKRAAAKGLQPGERQPQLAAAEQQGQRHSAQQHSRQQDVPSGSSHTPAVASGLPTSSTGVQGQTSAPSSTLTSLASANIKLLQPVVAAPSMSTSKSDHDIISTVHPPPSSFGHRNSLLTNSLARGLHPSVILLQQHLASHTLLGSSARAIATLAALRDFIADYKTPRGAVLNRDMVTKLGHQISGITSARPLGSSAGNAVRYLKYEISVIPADMGEEEAKSHLLSRIDHFVRDRIVFASRVISTHVSNKIKPQGDVVLTFARSSVVEQCLVDAWKRDGKRFEVICVGGETFEEGKRLTESLLTHGIPTSYAPLTSLAAMLHRVSLVLLGTASLLSNGALYSRAGTATVAMMAHTKKIPVIVCCETFKFSERVRLEGVGGNEQADGSLLLGSGSVNSSGRNSAGQNVLPPNLSALNLLYDLTPARYVTAVASEVGLSGPESVAILLRDYKSILFGS